MNVAPTPPSSKRGRVAALALTLAALPVAAGPVDAASRHRRDNTKRAASTTTVTTKGRCRQVHCARHRTCTGRHTRARKGVPLNVIQRQLGHRNLGVTSIHLQGIDPDEIIQTAHGRSPMIPASVGLTLPRRRP